MTYSYSYGDEPLERAFSSSGTEFELVSDDLRESEVRGDSRLA